MVTTRYVRPSTNTSPSLDFSIASTLEKERRAPILHMFRYLIQVVDAWQIQNLIAWFSVLLAESCKCRKAGIKTRARKHQFKGRM